MADNKLTTSPHPLTTTNTSNTTPKRTQKIKLNVGGEYFVTSRDTLLRFDESYFGGLLRSGREPEEDDGAYFIDRDPSYFRIILNYMRTGFLEEVYGNQRRHLQLELSYFGISKPTLLERSHVFYDWMPEVTNITVEWDSVKPITPFSDCLKDMLETPTIIIAETKEGEVFGGFAEGWTPDGACLPEKSWLFTLANTSGLPEMQFHLINEFQPVSRPRGISFGVIRTYYSSNAFYLDYLQFYAQKDMVQCSLWEPLPDDETYPPYIGDKYRSLKDVCKVDGAQVHLQVWKLHR